MTALLAATFLLLQLLCQAFATEGSGCEPPSGFVKFPEYNASYKIHEEHVSWAEARNRCVAEGADLAVITSVEQVRQIINATILDSVVFVHIGIRRPTTTSPWVRIDNGLPAALSGVNDIQNFNCVNIWRGRGGTFSDYDCDSHSAFVCETPLAEGCPSPVGPEDSQGPPASKGDAEQKSAEE